MFPLTPSGSIEQRAAYPRLDKYAQSSTHRSFRVSSITFPPNRLLSIDQARAASRGIGSYETPLSRILINDLASFFWQCAHSRILALIGSEAPLFIIGADVGSRRRMFLAFVEIAVLPARVIDSREFSEPKDPTVHINLSYKVSKQTHQEEALTSEHYRSDFRAIRRKLKAGFNDSADLVSHSIHIFVSIVEDLAAFDCYAWNRDRANRNFQRQTRAQTTAVGHM